MCVCVCVCVCIVKRSKNLLSKFKSVQYGPLKQDNQRMNQCLPCPLWQFHCYQFHV